ncbi:MAG: cell division protein FtsA [Chloroflexi bacterium]|nr:cell division protein FtsA [Chloroflexota bacterium]
MFKDVLHTAIDVGTTKVCTLVAHLHTTGVVEILGVGISPSLGLKKGVVVSLHEAREAIRSSLEEASRSAGVGIPWAYVTVTGSHLEAFTRWGSIHAPHYSVPISYEELDRVVEAAYPAELPPEKQVLHLLPRVYAVDGLKGVRNPIGMHALRLDVETLCVTGATAFLHNLVRAVESNGVQVRALVAHPLASGEAVLTRDEKEMGAVLLDVGGGTVSIAAFQQGTLWSAAVLPVGGYQFTNDLAISLNTPFDIAEEVKLKHGHLLPEAVADQEVRLKAFGDNRTVKVESRDIAQVLRERANEVLQLASLKVRNGFGYSVMPPAGVVLAGGCANLPGMETLARLVFNVPVRIGLPRGVEGIPQGMQNPTYAASVGALLWGVRHYTPREQLRTAWVNGNGQGERTTTKWMNWLRERARRVAL